MSATATQQPDLKALAQAVLQRNTQKSAPLEAGNGAASSCCAVAPPSERNTQQTERTGTQADAAKRNTERNNTATRLGELSAEACVSLKGYITPAALLSKLAPEDLADLEAMPTDQAVRFLRAFATATVWTDMRRQGIAPPGWDQPATCKRCGPVYLWTSIDVAGCPWCWNRLRGFKIPRPGSPKIL